MEHQIDTAKPMITTHFSYLECNLQNAPQQVIENYEYLLLTIMEPIREHFGPLVVTSGYRPPERNKRAGGQDDSFHLAENGKAAMDFKPWRREKLLVIWDWLRLDSQLMYDKIILERDKNDAQTPLIIHVQLDKNNPPRREAYEGFTGAGSSYVGVNVNPLKVNPSQNSRQV